MDQLLRHKFVPSRLAVKSTHFCLVEPAQISINGAYSACNGTCLTLCLFRTTGTSQCQVLAVRSWEQVQAQHRPVLMVQLVQLFQLFQCNTIHSLSCSLRAR